MKPVLGVVIKTLAWCAVFTFFIVWICSSPPIDPHRPMPVAPPFEPSDVVEARYVRADQEIWCERFIAYGGRVVIQITDGGPCAFQSDAGEPYPWRP